MFLLFSFASLRFSSIIIFLHVCSYVRYVNFEKRSSRLFVTFVRHTGHHLLLYFYMFVHMVCHFWNTFVTPVHHIFLSILEKQNQFKSCDEHQLMLDHLTNWAIDHVILYSPINLSQCLSIWSRKDKLHIHIPTKQTLETWTPHFLSY